MRLMKLTFCWAVHYLTAIRILRMKEVSRFSQNKNGAYFSTITTSDALKLTAKVMDKSGGVAVALQSGWLGYIRSQKKLALVALD